MTGGGVGDCAKIRKMRVALIEDTPEKREEIVRVFMKAMGVNGCQSVMEAIEKIDPDFVSFALKRLEEAENTSTTFDPNDIVGEDHLLGKTPEKVAEGKKRVDKLLQALEKDGITSKDFVVFSVATALASLINGANLRPQDFFNMIGKTLYYKPDLERMMIRLPIDGKQTKTAVRKLSTACFEHGLEGEGVVRRLAVMALVGRPFLKKANDGELDVMFGPLGMNGQVLSSDVFGTVLRDVGAAFFGLGNVDVNAFRTAQDTLAVEHTIELGLGLDAMYHRASSRAEDLHRGKSLL